MFCKISWGICLEVVGFELSPGLESKDEGKV